jgi:4a-hydroxytetrahydrobiopterin dehydratase
MQKLSPEDIEARMERFPEWTASGDTIQRTFSFDDFRAAMDFVGRIADLAESQQHHPDIMIRYNKVTLSLTTHDASGVTEGDFTFAESIDALVGAC